MQEQEALVKELTEVLQRQKTRVAALQKDRAEQGAQLAAYQPAEQDKLRSEMSTLRERVGELAGMKVNLACVLFIAFTRLQILYVSCLAQSKEITCCMIE